MNSNQFKYVCFLFIGFGGLGCAELGFPCVVGCEEVDQIEVEVVIEEDGQKPSQPTDTSQSTPPSQTPVQTPPQAPAKAVPAEDYFTITNNLSSAENIRVEVQKYNSKQKVTLPSGQCIKIHKSLHKNSINVVFHQDGEVFKICRPSTDEETYTRYSFKSQGVYYCDHGPGFGYDVAVSNYKIESLDNFNVDTGEVPAQCGSVLK